MPEKLVVDEPGARFTISYEGLSNFSGGSHRAYDSALSIKNNPIYNQLKAKAKQLRGAAPEAIRLLIVCDGDCATMSRRTPLEGFSATQIAERFLRDTNSVDLVLLATVEEHHGGVWRPRQLSCRYDLAAAPLGFRPNRLTNSVVILLRQLLQSAVERIPKPVLTPANAVRRNIDSEVGAKMSYAIKAKGKEVRISARALQELLAGVISYDRFAEAHGWEGGQGNMFLGNLTSGQLFVSARIDSGVNENEDDDWIVFEFGAPDPAVSPFRRPLGIRRAEEGE
jgi:hypothetical protein